MKYKTYFFIIIYNFLIFNILLSNENEIKNLWEIDEFKKSYIIEKIPEYKSTINWTTGKIKTELSLEINIEDPNIGKNKDYYYNIIKEELKQNLIKAMGYLRISDIFLLKDYFYIKSEQRYEILFHVDKSFYYPIIQKNKKLYGALELYIFGTNGIANIFYKNIDKVENKKYLLTNRIKKQEYYDSLLIDASIFQDFKPSIFMRIYDQDGMLLYGPETIEKKYLELNGVCEYTSSLIYALNSPRIGKKIFYIIPFKTYGRTSTYFILHNSDASKLFNNKDTIDSINKGAVVVFKPQKEE